MITKFMGLVLFLAGFLLIALAMFALLGFIQPSGLFERLLMFIGGLILCVLGYIMARDQPING
jgi:hypothetical protein